MMMSTAIATRTQPVGIRFFMVDPFYTPSPFFAKMLQQTLGGIEGEVRIMLQYLFQSWNFRGPQKYRDMLLKTGTEEIGHVEMLAIEGERHS